MAFPLPDKPSIAVLPFVDLSVDRNSETLAEGMSEDILTALSKLDELFVISRTTSSTYKGKDVTVSPKIWAFAMCWRAVFSGRHARHDPAY